MDARDYEDALHECRAKLADRLRWEEVPDAVWGYVCSEGLAYDAIISGSWERLENEARNYRERGSSGRGGAERNERGASEAPQEIKVELGEHTLRRAEVFGTVAVTLAEQRPDVQRFRRRYWRGSPDADRRRHDRLASRLARAYGWDKHAASLFLLTGQEPEHRPLKVSVVFGESEHEPNTSARVVVEADAWTEVEEVANAYRAARRQLLGGDRKKRKMDERSLEVVRFVTRQRKKQGSLPPWPELQSRWNRDYPQWRYDDRNALARAYKRAYERLVRPEYNRPKWKRRR